MCVQSPRFDSLRLSDQPSSSVAQPLRASHDGTPTLREKNRTPSYVPARLVVTVAVGWGNEQSAIRLDAERDSCDMGVFTVIPFAWSRPSQHEFVRRISQDDILLAELERTLERRISLVRESYASRWTRKNKHSKEEPELASAHLVVQAIGSVPVVDDGRPAAPLPRLNDEDEDEMEPVEERHMVGLDIQPGGCGHEEMAESELARSPTKNGTFRIDSKPHHGIRIDLSRVHPTVDRNSPPAHSPNSSAPVSIMSSPHSAFSAVSMSATTGSVGSVLRPAVHAHHSQQSLAR